MGSDLPGLTAFSDSLSGVSTADHGATWPDQFQKSAYTGPDDGLLSQISSLLSGSVLREIVRLRPTTDATSPEHPRVVLVDGPPRIYVSGSGGNPPSCEVEVSILGERMRVAAARVVLAAGGLGNLYLLQVLAEREGLTDLEKRLGVGYANHPKFTSHLLELDRPIWAGESQLNRTTVQGGKWIGVPTLDVEPPIAGGGELRVPRVSARVWGTNRQLSGLGGAVASFMGRVSSRVTSRFRQAQVVTYVEMPQNTSNFARFVDLDWSRPRLEVSATFPRESLDPISRQIRLLTQAIERIPALRTLRTTDLNLSELATVDAHHYMGTTRMTLGGLSDQGVVDQLGRVQGAPDVRVVGTSLLPVSAALHPTFLATLLARAISRRIVEELS